MMFEYSDWNRKCLFFRQKQFDSGFHLMAINEISRNSPEVIFGFRIIPCHLEDGLEKRVRLILLEELLVLLLVQDDP